MAHSCREREDLSLSYCRINWHSPEKVREGINVNYSVSELDRGQSTPLFRAHASRAPVRSRGQRLLRDPLRGSLPGPPHLGRRTWGCEDRLCSHPKASCGDGHALLLPKNRDSWVSNVPLPSFIGKILKKTNRVIS